MNCFYTWAVYFDVAEKWIWHFGRQEPLYWPVSEKSKRDGLFWRMVIQAAVDLEMLDYHGCLDAMR